MFYALASVLCLAVLFIVLAGAWVLCTAGGYFGRLWLSFLPVRSRANWLFTLRALPFLLAGLVTLTLALPAFLRFEPRASHEILEPHLLLLAALGALIVTGVTIRSFLMIRATRRARKQWRTHSRRLQIKGVQVPVYRVPGSDPLLAVTGVFRPEIFVAEMVIEKLSTDELLAAIAHEVAHVSAWDNLKQLVLKTTRLFPRSDGLWLNASEVAADEGAVASGASALDLSSALVKVGGLALQVPAGTMIAVSHLLPARAESTIEMRVIHLRKLLESGEAPLKSSAENRTYWPVFLLLLLTLTYATCVNAALPWFHEMLELLVR